MSMNANDITTVLYRHFMNKVRCDAAIHNNTNMLAYCGESDFIAVTRSGLIHEVEVKVSRADFWADFKNKPHRHLHLSGVGVPRLNPDAEVRHYNAKHEHIPVKRWGGMMVPVEVPTWEIKCREYLPTNYVEKKRPNYFWYACPKGMLQLDEVPEYCGLIEVEQHTYGTRAIITRKAPRIHSDKVFTDKMKTDMLRSLSFKFV